MCGFVGCVLNQCQDVLASEDLKEMNNLIYHRGPDDEGVYMDDHIQLGFRRLSIIDLESGHQPLSFENERYWIVFNGEIYNYRELRKDLQELGYEFVTDSEVEVIGAAYTQYGKKYVE